jgi:hypothetical protein
VWRRAPFGRRDDVQVVALRGVEDHLRVERADDDGRGARANGHAVVTSDPDDLRRLDPELETVDL